MGRAATEKVEKQRVMLRDEIPAQKQTTMFTQVARVSRPTFQGGSTGSNPVGATQQRQGQKEGKKEGACEDDLRVENVFKPTGLEDSRKLFRGSGSVPGCQFQLFEAVN